MENKQNPQSTHGNTSVQYSQDTFSDSPSISSLFCFPQMVVCTGSCNYIGCQFLTGVVFNTWCAVQHGKQKLLELLQPLLMHGKTSAGSQHAAVLTLFSKPTKQPPACIAADTYLHVKYVHIAFSECAESAQCKKKTSFTMTQSCSPHVMQLQLQPTAPATWQKYSIKRVLQLCKTVNDYRIMPCDQRTKCVLQINHFPRCVRKDRLER